MIGAREWDCERDGHAWGSWALQKFYLESESDNGKVRQVRPTRGVVMVGTRECPWCAGSANDEPDTDLLCRTHRAEYEGVSEDELDRMEAEQAAEYDVHMREWQAR